MPRSRNIKYAFFENDELAELEPLCRLFFIGLWTIADWKGNLVWREKKLKTQILPYDECDIKEYGKNLSKARFIRFYADHQNLYCNVVNFTAHQNPHMNEKKQLSKVTEYSEMLAQAVDLTTLAIIPDKIGTKPDKSGPTRADSLSLIPDPLLKEPATAQPVKSKKFIPPTVEQVREYVIEKGYKVDAENFVDFYATTDWFRGKTKIKSWKSCVSTWANRDQSTNQEESETMRFE